jgi:hypothetical protein
MLKSRARAESMANEAYHLLTSQCPLFIDGVATYLLDEAGFDPLSLISGSNPTA